MNGGISLCVDNDRREKVGWRWPDIREQAAKQSPEGAIGHGGCRKTNVGLKAFGPSKPEPEKLEPEIPEPEKPELEETAGALSGEIVRATADVVVAFLAQNEMTAEELPGFCRQVANAISLGCVDRRPAVRDSAAAGAHEEGRASSSWSPGDRRPAVDPARSVESEWIICLEDGVRRKMLQRYLRVRYRMSPEQYRARWNLPEDYPMVAPGYARRRADIARETGFAAGATPEVES